MGLALSAVNPKNLIMTVRAPVAIVQTGRSSRLSVLLLVIGAKLLGDGITIA